MHLYVAVKVDLVGILNCEDTIGWRRKRRERKIQLWWSAIRQIQTKGRLVYALKASTDRL